jgi:hypothetical protein
VLLSKIFILIRSIYENRFHIVQVSTNYTFLEFLNEFTDIDIHFVFQIETLSLLDINKTFNENEIVQADSFIYG